METEAVQVATDFQGIMNTFAQIAIMTIMGAAAAFIKKYTDQQNSESKQRSTREIINEAFLYGVRAQYPKVKGAKEKADDGKIPERMRQDLRLSVIGFASKFAQARGIAIGFYGMSVSENLWYQWDEESESDIPYNLETGSKHWDIFYTDNTKDRNDG